MSDLQTIISMYNNDPNRKSKNAFYRGQPTKDFLKKNRRYIVEGNATYYADETKVYKPSTGRFVNRLTKTGRVQKKYKGDKMVGSVIEEKKLGETIRYSANDDDLNGVRVPELNLKTGITYKEIMESDNWKNFYKQLFQDPESSHDICKQCCGWITQEDGCVIEYWKK